MEGIGCLIAGAIGSGNGTTSYSENIGAIGITKVRDKCECQYVPLKLIVNYFILKISLHNFCTLFA